ncbi:MAG: cytochrome c peroxidase [Ferrovibrio sp.]
MFLAAGLVLAMSGTASAVDFDATQTRRILGHGPWPVAAATDHTNRLSGNPDAIRLGALLFNEPRLSGNGGISCQTCHRPDHGWSEAKARSEGLQQQDRNAPGLLNVRLQRWFGWDGANDSLWAASIRPIVADTEMGGSISATAGLLRKDSLLTCLASRVAPDYAAAADEDVAVLAAKSLAAFMETLASPRTPFDDFRDALAANDAVAMARYPEAAQRGLALFTGRGQCGTCHSGPNFSNGEFHDTGLRFFLTDANGARRVDPGRHGGISRLKASPFNLLGRHNDDPNGTASIPVRHIAQLHRNWGEFKVPPLRNLAATAPYIHDGSKVSLRDVILHYSDLDEDRLHSDGEAILKPLHLNAAEIADLQAFLDSLSVGNDSAARYAELRRDAAACR